MKTAIHTSKYLNLELDKLGDDRPDTVPPHPETLLVGEIKFTR